MLHPDWVVEEVLEGLTQPNGPGWSPTGEPAGRVELPVAHTTSCVFGGPRLNVLYATTAVEGLDPLRGDLGARGLLVPNAGVEPSSAEYAAATTAVGWTVKAADYMCA